MNRRLIDFFVHAEFPQEVRILGLDQEAGCRTGALREQLMRTVADQGSWVVVALGGTWFDKLGVARPEGLTDMPRFPFDGDDLHFRRLDLLVLLLGRRDSPWGDDDQEEALLGRLGYRRVCLGRGHRSRDGRNALGFIDGSSNLTGPTEQQQLHDTVVRTDGGTLMAYRHMRLDLPAWEAIPVEQQEAIIGRRKATGEPLGDEDELGQPSYRFDPRGLRTPLDSHVRQAYPRRHRDPLSLESDRRHRLYRCGFSDSDAAGLHFLCLQRDLRAGFDHVFGRWMADRHGPGYGHGADALLKSSVISTMGGGYFFVDRDAAVGATGLTGGDLAVLG